MNIQVYGDAGDLAVKAAALLTRLITEAPGVRAAVGFAGGSTPGATYMHLRDEAIDWTKVDAFLTDERWVPHDHPDSNGKMVIETLLGKVETNFYRPRWGEWLEPDESAAFYEADLRHLFPDGHADVVMLGMGEDGHTASLFPDTAALTEQHRWYIGNHVPARDTWRLTATLPLLCNAHHVVFLAAGTGKAKRVHEVMSGISDLPAALVTQKARGEVWWLLDALAATEI